MNSQINELNIFQLHQIAGNAYAWMCDNKAKKEQQCENVTSRHILLCRAFILDYMHWSGYFTCYTFCVPWKQSTHTHQNPVACNAQNYRIMENCCTDSTTQKKSFNFGDTDPSADNFYAQHHQILLHYCDFSNEIWLAVFYQFKMQQLNVFRDNVHINSKRWKY